MNAFRIDRSSSGSRVRVARRRRILRGERCRALIIFSFLLTAGLGCTVSPSAQKYKNEIHPRQDVVVIQDQLRLRMRALAEPFSGLIVESADRITAGTTNRAVQREALLWKIEGVPAVREALFRPEPYLAVCDIWVLTWQMTDYFESGRGKQALGEAAPIASKTCQDMEAEIKRVAASMTRSGDVSDVRKFSRQWAREHPIHNSIAGRESLLSLAAEREIPASFSPEEAAGAALETMDDLTRRMDIYSVQLFDQARWQAELVAMDLSSQYQLEKAMPLADSAVRSANDAVAILKRLEPAVNDALAVAKSTPEVIDRERTATLQQIRREREAAMAQLRETIDAEHKRVVDDAEKVGAQITDHTVLRVAELTGAVLATVFVGVVVLLLITCRIFTARRRIGE